MSEPDYTQPDLTIVGEPHIRVYRETHGETGYLVDSPAECAQRCLEILADPELGKKLGRAGKEHARREFLSPRLLRDWLGLLTELDT